MIKKYLLAVALMQREKPLQLHVNSDVSDVRNVKKHVRTVQSPLQISALTLITKNVQTVVHAKKHVRDTLFFKRNTHSFHMFNFIPAEKFSSRDFYFTLE